MSKSLKPFILFVLFLVGLYTRAEAKLQAVTTPIITASGPVTFCQGNSVTLTASPTGGGNYQSGETYQWMKGGVNITGATTSVYTAVSTGSYTVKVSLGAQSATSTATLVTVNFLPLVISSPDNVKCANIDAPLKVRSTSLLFDGVSNGVSLIANSDVKRYSDVYNNFTIECWVNPLATHEIDAQTQTGTPGTTGQKYLFNPVWGDIWDGNHAGMGLSVGTNGVSVYEHGNGYLPSLLVWQGNLEGWNHIAVVYQAGIPSLYVNGILVKTGLKSTKLYVHPSAINFGSASYGYYKGYLDEVRIWNTIRTPEQLAAAMRSSVNPQKSPSLVGYWNFDEGSGTQVNDLTTRANNGTLNNTSCWYSNVNAAGVTWSPATDLSAATGFNVNAISANTFTATTMDLNGCQAQNNIAITDITNASVSINADRLQVCSTPKPVVWRNTYQCNITDNGIIQAVNAGWTTGAESMQQITGDGYVEYAIEAGNFPRMLGLGSPNNNTGNIANNFNYCNYQFYMDNGTLHVYEGSSWKKTVGAYQGGDIIRIAREKTEIKYYFKNALVWTTTAAISSPLIADASLNMPGAPFRNVKINNALDPVKFTASPANGKSYEWKINNVIVSTTAVNTLSAVVYPNDVVKCNVTYDNCTSPYLSNELTIGTSSPVPEEITINPLLNVCPAPEPVVWRNMSNCELTPDAIQTYAIYDWMSRAESVQQIATNGYVEYTVEAVNQIKVFGLASPNNGNSGFNFINYSFYISNASLYIFQQETNLGYFGTVATGDLLRISVENGIVRHFKNNVLLYTNSGGASSGQVAAICFAKSPSTFSLEKIKIQKSNNLTAMEISSPSTLSGVYQWYVNHNSVGTNSKTLSQAGLIDRDEVKLIVMPVDKCTAPSAYKRTVSYAVASLSSVSIEPANLSVCPAPEAVVWKNLAKCSVSGSNLVSTSTVAAWNAGAESEQQISGNGYIEYSIESTAYHRMIGLADPNNNDPNYTSLKYGIFLVQGGFLQIYESGVKIDKGWTYSTTQKIRIAIDRGVVRYYLNGSLLHTSDNRYTTALVADVAMYHVGTLVNTVTIQKSNTGPPMELKAGLASNGSYQWYLNNISLPVINSNLIQTGLINSDKVKVTFIPSNLCSTHATSTAVEITSNTNPVSNLTLSSPNLSVCPGAPEIVIWKDFIKCSPTSTGIVKNEPSADAWGSVSAQSVQQITGDGFLEYTIEENMSYRMIGLNAINSTPGYNSIKYAFYLRPDGKLNIFENGNSKLEYNACSPGIKIKVACENGSVKYYYNNVLIYRSSTPVIVNASNPLIADLDMWSNNTGFNNVLIQKSNTGSPTEITASPAGKSSYQWYVNNDLVQNGTSNVYQGQPLPGYTVKCEAESQLTCNSNTTNTLSIVAKQNISSPVSISVSKPELFAQPQTPENVTWQYPVNATVTATGINKSGADGWISGGESVQEIINGGFVEYTVESSLAPRFIGLSTTNSADGSYPGIAFAFYLRSDGQMEIRESYNISRGIVGNYSTGGKLRIELQNGEINYYYNGIWKAKGLNLVSASTRLIVDVSLYAQGASFNNVKIQKGAETAVITAASSVSGSYQWLINGFDGGTSNSINRASFSTGDKITVKYTPADGCTSYSSVMVQKNTGPGGIGDETSNKLWLDASGQTGLTNGGLINSFKDKSSANNHFNSPATANNPKFVTNVLNQKPVIRFDRAGSYKYFENSSAAIGALTNNTNTLFTLAKANSGSLDNTTNAQQSVFSPVGWHSGIGFLGFPNSTAIYIYDVDNKGNYYGGMSQAVTQGNWAITAHIIEESNGTKLKGYNNGNYLGVKSTVFPMYDHSVTRIGCSVGTPGDYSFPLNGDIAEIIAYNRTVNDAERTIVENYMAAKYALTISNDFYTNNDPLYIEDVQGIGTPDNGANKHSFANSNKHQLSLIEQNGSLNGINEFLISGHNGLANTVITTNLPSGVKDRWQRVWYLEKSAGSTIDARLVFDLGIPNPDVLPEKYRLLYRSNTTENFKVLKEGGIPVKPVLKGTKLDFSLVNGTLPGSGLYTGYYTLGISSDKNVVINGNNEGAGSLRQAILDANANPDVTIIYFDIDGENKTIEITSELPPITTPVVIDGTSQPGYNKATPATIVDIKAVSGTSKGILFQGNSVGSEIKGLKVNNFSDYGVLVQVENVIVEDVVVH